MLEPFDVWTLERAVTVDGGHHERRELYLGHAGHGVGQREPAPLEPPTHSDLERARRSSSVVEPNRDATREGGGGLLEEARSIERCRAEDHPGNTPLDELLDVRHGPDASAGLDRDAAAAGDREHDVTILPTSVTSGVEVDDVEPVGPSLHKGLSQRSGIPVGGLVLVRTLEEADGAAAAQVDR